MYKKPHRFPLTGPLKDIDYKNFVARGKTEFFNLWDLKWIEDKMLDDFIIKKQLGSGAFGIVYLSEYKNKGTFYAQKVIEKSEIIRSNELNYIKNEMNIMKSINFPFTIYLEHFFKDNRYIYFIIPFISGGELHQHLRKSNKFDEEEARFFGAQVVMAIEYLHALHIVYRDLKPENLLIDRTGYLKLSDFGFSKILKTRTYTLCGTPEFLAPEIILSKGYGMSVDWWAFGVLLFEMVSGKSPFYHEKVIRMFENAASGSYLMPTDISLELQDLITNILQTDVSKRYGNLFNGVDDIKNHKWFSSIQWQSLFNRQIQAPYLPKEISTDSRLFSKKIKLKSSLEDKYKKEFECF